MRRICVLLLAMTAVVAWVPQPDEVLRPGEVTIRLKHGYRLRVSGFVVPTHYGQFLTDAPDSSGGGLRLRILDNAQLRRLGVKATRVEDARLREFIDECRSLPYTLADKLPVVKFEASGVVLRNKLSLDLRIKSTVEFAVLQIHSVERVH